MPDTLAEILSKALEAHKWAEDTEEGQPPWTYAYGLFRYREYAQDQGRVEFDKGSYSAIFTPVAKDSQSDDPVNWAGRIVEHGESFYRLFNWATTDKAMSNQDASTYEEEEASSLADFDLDTTGFLGPDEDQIDSGRLISETFEASAQGDMRRLRELIFAAEDTGFTAEQSQEFAPWLLRFAEQHRDSDDPNDAAAVWSAIRTGASMLTPADVGSLLALLGPGHPIETSLVAVKMVGRIFEAQPPSGIDQHIELSKKVEEIANSFLNSYAVAVSECAASANLAVYALAAMGSSRTERTVRQVVQIGIDWFRQSMMWDLCELRELWGKQGKLVPEPACALVDNAIQVLALENK